MYQNIFIDRDDEGKSHVYLWDDEHGLKVGAYSKWDYAYTKDPNGDLHSIYGHKVRKTFRWNRGSLEVFESDVPRETRVLTDVYMKSDEPSTGHIIGFFDIEADSEGGFPNIETADKEITAISIYNSETKQYTVFMLDKDRRINELHLTEDNETLYRFDTEFELLDKFMEFYHDQKFTILTGWNVDGFDIPYLYKRMCAILGVDTANMLSPIGKVRWNEYRERYQLAGISVLDYILLYKKFRFVPRPSYRLHDICVAELGKGKIEYEGSLNQLAKEDPHKFIDYNLTDTKLVVELDQKLQFIDLARNICHVGHVPYENFMDSSRWIEGTILVYLHRKGIVSPNKPLGGQEAMRLRNESDEEGFEGAYVKPPVPGLYKWVYSLDLQSLYPSIIMSLNISPDTKAGFIHNWDFESYIQKKVDKYRVSIVGGENYNYSREDLEKFLNKTQLAVSSNGILYIQDKKGIIPEILDVWFKQRLEYKTLMKKYSSEGDKKKEEYYDRRQLVQKIFLNSIYGVLGLPIFRFYDLDNALAVTATGQDVIKTSAKWINTAYKMKTGIEEDYCIYIDTDSLYFSSLPVYFEDFKPLYPHSKMEEFTIGIARQMEDQLNTMYSIMAKKLFNVDPDKHRFVIKGEKIAKTAFWLAKKRYALLTVYDLELDVEKEKLVVKGLDVVRSSFPLAFQKFMSQTLKDILNEKGKEYVDEQVLQFKNKLKDMNYMDLARNTSINGLTKYDDPNEKKLNVFTKGAPIHVKAGLAYNRFLKLKGLDKKYPPIYNGEKAKYVYLKNNPYELQTIAFKGYGDPKEVIELVTNYIDHNKLFEAELAKKLDNFYTALKWGLLPTKVNQNLNKFFE